MPVALVDVATHGSDSRPLEQLALELCSVRFDVQKAHPSTMPFFDGGATLSGCDLPGRRVLVRVSTLLENARREDGTQEEAWQAPVGVVLQTARCGSTAIANMLSALPGTVVLSEPSPIYEALSRHADGFITREETLALLRLIALLYAQVLAWCVAAAARALSL